MSIIPVGNRKEQVKQGALRNQSILESDLFKKFGQGASALDPDKKRDDPGMQPTPSGGVDEAMMQGALDAPGQADQHEQQIDPMNQAPSSPQGVQPAGAPASRFLGQNPDDEGQQADPNMIYQAERQKIRGFIGNEFGMKLTQNPDGTFSVALRPPNNTPVQDPTGFMDTLLQHIGGGTVNEEDTPAASDVGGALTLKYRPSGAGPEKIRPGGKGRR